MTSIDSWLLDHAPIMALIIIFVVYGTILWIRTGGVVENREAIKKHLKDREPHTQCPAHAVTLRNVQDDVKTILKKIEVIDGRIYTIYKNGSQK